MKKWYRLEKMLLLRHVAAQEPVPGCTLQFTKSCEVLATDEIDFWVVYVEMHILMNPLKYK